MKIEIAVEKDFYMISDMTRQLFEDEQSYKCLSCEGYKERLLNYIDSGCVAYLFYEDSVITGYALVNMKRQPYYLNDFFISREHRRQRKGTEAFYKLLAELKTDCIDLDVFSWNERGKKFWESLGFNELAVIMRKGKTTENKQNT